MDEYSETNELPNSREKRIEDKQRCEEKHIAVIPNADGTLQDFANLRWDESSMPSTSGKIQKTSRKTDRESDDLDTSRKSSCDAQYSPYKIIKKKESGKASDLSKLHDLVPSVLITDAKTKDQKEKSSAVGSITSEGGIEKFPEIQFSKWKISDRCTEPMSYDSRRKRKSNEAKIPDDVREPSEGGSSGQKRRKSEKATQTTGESEETPLQITPMQSAKDVSLNYSIKKSNIMDAARKVTKRRTEVPDQTLVSKISSTIEIEFGKSPDLAKPVPTKDCILNYSIKKSTMDELSARNVIKRRTEVPDQTLKISSTIKKEFGKSSDLAKPSTSGENLVLSKKQSNAETCRVLDKTKMEIRSLNIYQMLKLSEKEDQIFDEHHLDVTIKVITFEIERKVKTFFKEHLTDIHNPKPLLSKARKLENSLAKINKILWDIPKLPLQDNANAGGETLLDLIIHLKRGALRRAIMGESFDLRKIDEVQLMKKYDAYVQRWVIAIDYYENDRDDVYKAIEKLQTLLKEAIERCEEGKKFINQLDKSQFLRDIAVIQRSHQIGEDITRPPHVGYNVPDSYLEKVKEAYLNPIPCTDELHPQHHRSASCSDFSLNPFRPKSPEIAIESYGKSGPIRTEKADESRDCLSPISFGYSPKDFENVEKAIREFLQKDSSSSDENDMENFQRKELSGLGLNSNVSKNLPGQSLIRSSDQQSSTDPSNQITQKMESSGVQETLADTTSQPQPIISMSTSGIERSSTDTENQHIQPTSVIDCNSNIQQSSTNTGSILFQLLTRSNDRKNQTDINSKLTQPLGSTDDKQCSTDPNCQTITTLGEKIKNPDTLVLKSSEFQEHEECASDSKDQNESEAEISSGTHNCKSLDLSSSADNQIIELSEQKTVINTESRPIKVSEVLSDPTRNQITSTPIKRADVREHMDNREQLEYSPSEISSLYEIESPENFSAGSSCDSEFLICNISMEIDEMHDQLILLMYEIEEFGKNLSNFVNKTKDAVKKLVESKEKINQNLTQFLRTKIPDLIRKKAEKYFR